MHCPLAQMSFFGFLFFCFFLLPDFSGGTQKNNHVFQLDDEETIFTVEQWAVSVSSKKKTCKNPWGSMGLFGFSMTSFTLKINESHVGEYTIPRWRFQICFLFSPRNLGKMNPFWRVYFSKGWNHQPDSHGNPSWVFVCRFHHPKFRPTFPPKELGTGGANVESLSVFTRPQIVPWSGAALCAMKMSGPGTWKAKCHIFKAIVAGIRGKVA